MAHNSQAEALDIRRRRWRQVLKTTQDELKAERKKSEVIGISREKYKFRCSGLEKEKAGLLKRIQELEAQVEALEAEQSTPNTFYRMWQVGQSKICKLQAEQTAFLHTLDKKDERIAELEGHMKQTLDVKLGMLGKINEQQSQIDVSADLIRQQSDKIKETE